MNRYLLDTDHFTLLCNSHSKVLSNVANYASDIHVCVITVEEQLIGWLSAIRHSRDRAKIERCYDRLARAVSELAKWRIASFPVSAMTVVDSLKRLRLNVGSNDLKIGAIAIDLNATVVTRNARDFSRIPGLSFIDWSI